MTNKGTHFSRRMTRAEESRDDGDAGAMGGVGKGVALEPEAPDGVGAGWRQDERGTALLACALQDGEEIGMERRGVELAALEPEGDRHARFVDVLERYGGLADAAALAHEDKPLLHHPARHGGELGLDGALVIFSDLALLLCRDFPGLHLAAGIRIGEPAADGFGHEDAEIDEAKARGIVMDRREGLGGFAPIDKAAGDIVGEQARDDGAVLIEEGEDIAESGEGVFVRAGAGVARLEVIERPCLPALALADLWRAQFLDLGFGAKAIGALLSTRCIDEDTGGLANDPAADGIAVLQPEVRGTIAGVNRGHESSVPQCAQNAKKARSGKKGAERNRERRTEGILLPVSEVLRCLEGAWACVPSCVPCGAGERGLKLGNGGGR